VQIKPAAFDRKFDPCAELFAVGLQHVEKWGVYLLNVDATVLHRLNPGGDLDQLARSGLRKRRSAVSFMRQSIGERC
jgi:hypothetical protein